MLFSLILKHSYFPGIASAKIKSNGPSFVPRSHALPSATTKDNRGSSPRRVSAMALTAAPGSTDIKRAHRPCHPATTPPTARYLCPAPKGFRPACGRPTGATTRPSDARKLYQNRVPRSIFTSGQCDGYGLKWLVIHGAIVFCVLSSGYSFN